MNYKFRGERAKGFALDLILRALCSPSNLAGYRRYGAHLSHESVTYSRLVDSKLETLVCNFAIAPSAESRDSLEPRNCGVLSRKNIANRGVGLRDEGQPNWNWGARSRMPRRSWAPEEYCKYYLHFLGSRRFNNGLVMRKETRL
jgi:hypothetical protein